MSFIVDMMVLFVFGQAVFMRLGPTVGVALYATAGFVSNHSSLMEVSYFN
jgi:hypothetical protein